MATELRGLESLLNVSTAFELVHLSSDLVYQKSMHGGMRPPAQGEPR